MEMLTIIRPGTDLFRTPADLFLFAKQLLISILWITLSKQYESENLGHMDLYI